MGIRGRDWMWVILGLGGIVALIDFTYRIRRERPAAGVVLPISATDFRLLAEVFESGPLASLIPVSTTMSGTPKQVEAHADYTEPPLSLLLDEVTVLKLTVSMSKGSTSLDEDIKNDDLLKEFNRRLALGKIASGSTIKPVFSAPEELQLQLADGVDEKTVTTKRQAEWTWYVRPKEVGDYPVSLTITSKKRFPNGKLLFNKVITVERTTSSIVADVRRHPFHVAVDTIATLGGLVAIGEPLRRRRRKAAVN